MLVGNADAYLADPHAPPGPDVAALLDGWDGRSVRLLGQPADDPAAPGTFSGHRFVGFSLLPWRLVRDLPPTFGDLVRAVWRPAEAAGALEVVPYRRHLLRHRDPGRLPGGQPARRRGRRAWSTRPRR